MRSDADELVSSLLEVEHELEAIQQEVKQVQISVSQRRSAAQMSVQVVRTLPFEVIREIVLHTIWGPDDHHRILHQSHISRPWREVVIGCSMLFTQANWVDWPVSLVDTWCSRAGPHLLRVSLKRSLYDMIDPTLKLALLETLFVQVGKLQVDTLPRFRESVNNAARGMFQLHMPSLKYLNVKATVPTFNIEAKNMPALRVLELTNLIPRISAPLTSVIGFRYYPIRFNTRIFDQLPNLQHLVCDMPDIGVGWGPVVLPSLMSLEVQWVTRKPINKVLLLFRVFLLPTLQSLILHDTFYDGEDMSTPFSH